MSASRRVVVTGMGIISPLGNELETTWQNILAGKSGAKTVTTFDVTDYPTKFQQLEIRGKLITQLQNQV